jgi:hypothetical protein
MGKELYIQIERKREREREREIRRKRKYEERECGIVVEARGIRQTLGWFERLWARWACGCERTCNVKD